MTEPELLQEKVKKKKNSSTKRKVKKALIIGGIAAGTCLAAYGVYKYSKFVSNMVNNPNVQKAGMKAAEAIANKYKNMSMSQMNWKEFARDSYSFGADLHDSAGLGAGTNMFRFVANHIPK